MHAQRKRGRIIQKCNVVISMEPVCSIQVIQVDSFTTNSILHVIFFLWCSVNLDQKQMKDLRQGDK